MAAVGARSARAQLLLGSLVFLQFRQFRAAIIRVDAMNSQRLMRATPSQHLSGARAAAAALQKHQLASCKALGRTKSGFKQDRRV